jgi:hypothetical protein
VRARRRTGPPFTKSLTAAEVPATVAHAIVRRARKSFTARAICAPARGTFVALSLMVRTRAGADLRPSAQSGVETMQTHRRGHAAALLASAGTAFILLAIPAVAGADPQPPAASATVSAAAVQEEWPALLDEPGFLRKGIRWVENFGRDESGQPKDGFYPELGHMITGAGWIAAGPGYRHHLFGNQAIVDASAAISWRAYKIAQARFELPYLADERLAVGARTLWQDFTQVRYYGLGGDTEETGVSDYRLKSLNIVGYANWLPMPHLTVTGSGGWLARPEILTSAGPFDRDDPDTTALYPLDPGIARLEQPSYLHGDAAVAFDTRDHPSYPTAGGFYRAAASTYRDRTDDAFTFERFEAEAAQFLPMFRNRSVFAVHWWTVMSHTSGDRDVPFYLLPSLGGHNTLRGYADYRFHDRHLMVVNAESRWALFPHVDGALFFDAGSVAARVRDLDFARTSAGFGVRVHTSKTTLARFDMARSEEGWRFLLKLTDPLRLGRLSRRTAAVPFVP